MLGIAMCLGLTPGVALAQLENTSMHRIVGAVLVLVLGVTVEAAEDKFCSVVEAMAPRAGAAQRSQSEEPSVTIDPTLTAPGT
jgi:hypothetical protein